MTTWEAFFLGIVQGLTEFLPVSSSGHLALGQYFLGFSHLQDYILFNMICHLGTLGAIFLVFFPLIKESLNTHSKLFWQVALGTLPLFPLVLILKPIKSFFDRPEILGPCFLITSLLIFLSLSYQFNLSRSPKQRVWKDSLVIGLFQAFAIFPGISRSGATISAARLLAWPKAQAIQFSFLLAIPAILGGTCLEIYQLWKTPSLLANALPWPIFLVGFFTSLIVGYLSLQLLIQLAVQDKWKYFAWYCLCLGIMTTLYFNLLR